MAERLFAERGFANVSVRDIAEEAGVTHPLIYYHYGSKKDLLAAVLEHTQARMRSVAAEGGDARHEVLRLVEESVAGSRTYMLTLARAFLDGMSPADWPGGFPGIESAVKALEGGMHGAEESAETRRLVAMAVALLFGWMLFRDQLLEIVGLPGDELAQTRPVLLQAEDRILAPAFVRAASAGGPGAPGDPA